MFICSSSLPENKEERKKICEDAYLAAVTQNHTNVSFLSLSFQLTEKLVRPVLLRPILHTPSRFPSSQKQKRQGKREGRSERNTLFTSGVFFFSVQAISSSSASSDNLSQTWTHTLARGLKWRSILSFT